MILTKIYLSSIGNSTNTFNFNKIQSIEDYNEFNQKLESDEDYRGKIVS